MSPEKEAPASAKSASNDDQNVVAPAKVGKHVDRLQIPQELIDQAIYARESELIEEMRREKECQKMAQKGKIREKMVEIAYFRAKVQEMEQKIEQLEFTNKTTYRTQVAMVDNKDE